jgi:MFS family permease
MQRNIALYPWLKFTQQLLFWQATWFLYFESRLSAAEAILLYVVADMATTALEVPSGYMSDRLGRRKTLLVAALLTVTGAALLVVGEGFAQFAVANALLGAAWAFSSGTDTSLLFESLKAEGRASEVERQEMKAWRFSFAGLALSALTGGLIALLDLRLPYIATTLAGLVLLAITFFLCDPPKAPRTAHRQALRSMGRYLTQPTLVWLLVFWVATYAFGHIPFVFGQPFIRDALSAAGLTDQTPLVTGAVSFLMMAISLAVSLVALPLRRALGLPLVLLLAFGMQVGLAMALALSNSLLVVALLLLRMVPDALTSAFLLARIQPLLSDDVRATYLSLQSLVGRILFSLMLTLAALYAPIDGALAYPDMQVILTGFVGLGGLLLVTLAATARRAGV